MCIRDRPEDRRPTARWLPVRDETPDHAARDPSPQPSADPCLLYTSDAADERSSVDLGGRRIIKKKNSARETLRRTNIKQKTTTCHQHSTQQATQRTKQEANTGEH